MSDIAIKDFFRPLKNKITHNVNSMNDTPNVYSLMDVTPRLIFFQKIFRRVAFLDNPNRSN